MGNQATDPSAFAECHEHALTFPMGGRCPECAVLQAQHERDCAVEHLAGLQRVLRNLLKEYCIHTKQNVTDFDPEIVVREARDALGWPQWIGWAASTDDVTPNLSTTGE